MGTTQESHIVFFHQAGADDASLFGGKAASLGRLAASGAVPPGFGLSIHAFRRWAQLGATGMPKEIGDEVRRSYAILEETSGLKNVPVAVRSSAVDEDGIGDSFAGLHDTYLNVRGPEAVIDAIISCWRSLSNERALEYRNARGLARDAHVMGVAVQQLVFADVSAVAFSADPITGDRDKIVINANYGLGEAVVSGAATPDTIVIEKQDLGRHHLTIGSKEVMTVRTELGTAERPVPRIMRGMPALTAEQATEIAKLAKQLEEQCGWPVDLECAIQDSRLFLLQCRPITTIYPGGHLDSA